MCIYSQYIYTHTLYALACGPMNETAAKIATREMPDKEESQPGSRSTAP